MYYAVLRSNGRSPCIGHPDCIVNGVAGFNILAVLFTLFFQFEAIILLGLGLYLIIRSYRFGAFVWCFSNADRIDDLLAVHVFCNVRRIKRDPGSVQFCDKLNVVHFSGQFIYKAVSPVFIGVCNYNFVMNCICCFVDRQFGALHVFLQRQAKQDVIILRCTVDVNPSFFCIASIIPCKGHMLRQRKGIFYDCLIRPSNARFRPVQRICMIVVTEPCINYRGSIVIPYNDLIFFCIVDIFLNRIPSESGRPSAGSRFADFIILLRLDWLEIRIHKRRRQRQRLVVFCNTIGRSKAQRSYAGSSGRHAVGDGFV